MELLLELFLGAERNQQGADSLVKERSDGVYRCNTIKRFMANSWKFYFAKKLLINFQEGCFSQNTHV